MGIAAAKKSGLDHLATVMADFQSKLQEIAKAGANPQSLLQLCDGVRDVECVNIGVRLEDRGNDGYVYYFDDRQAMEAEQKEAKEKAQEATTQKNQEQARPKAEGTQG